MESIRQTRAPLAQYAGNNHGSLSLTPSEKGFTRFPNSGGLPCLLRTSDYYAHLLSFCLRAMHVLVIDQALPDSRNQGVFEISGSCARCSSACAGSQTTQCVARCCLPPTQNEVGILI